MLTLETLASTAVEHCYSTTQHHIEELKTQNSAVTLEPGESLWVDNFYYKVGYEGTHPDVYTRESAYQRIVKIVDFLKPHAGLYIFDAFRTITTQAALYQSIYHDLKKQHPNLSEQELQALTKKYVAHPTDKSMWDTPHHNTGGAIDLAIYDLNSKTLWDFGTDIDNTTEHSTTKDFEKDYDKKSGIKKSRWPVIRKNRRIFFNLMKHFGFVNYEYEWWHYDLGDFIWANALNTDVIYDSMEILIQPANIIKHST